jgi:predicted AlkP superfamily phosphohydrolase/phosphomutase
VDAQSLWDILSAHGKKVGVMNVPVTYPPHAVNGFMITGLLSPTMAEVTYPPDLLEPYESELGKYRVMPSIQYKPGNEGEFIRDLSSLVDTRAKFASKLMRDHPWDLMMVHFLATDLAQHALWRHMDPTHPHHEPGNSYQDAIQSIYQRVDSAIGTLLNQLDGETTVIVMSDHGFGPLYGVANLNILLLEKGLMHLRRDPLTQLRAFLFRLGLTPAFVYKWLARLNLQNVVSRVSKSTRNSVFSQFLSFSDVDWRRTIAYSLGHMGQVYINVKGREPHGVIERGGRTGISRDYEQAREQVISALSTLDTPDGRPMLSQVIPSEVLSRGEHADKGADLHLVLDDYHYISCPLFATDWSVISKQIRGDSGSHRLHGILIARGPGIRAGKVDGARIVDLAPTMLRLLDCPIPADMDGRVLTRVIKSTPLDAYPLQTQVTKLPAKQASYVLSDAEEAELEARLRGLGYLG